MPVEKMAVTARSIVTAEVVLGVNDGIEKLDGDVPTGDENESWDEIVGAAARRPNGFVTTAHRVLVRARDDAFTSFLDYYSSSVREVGDFYDGLLSQETI